MTDAPSWPYFAHRDPRQGAPGFRNLYPSAAQTGMCSRDPVVNVTLRPAEPGEESPYWGFVRTGKPVPTMVWPSHIQLCLCFQGEKGLNNAVARGDGVPINLVVVEDDPT